jgi:uncharacterized membrane protein YccC
MARLIDWLGAGVDRGAVVHSARTAVAALTSYCLARLLKMPEAYWAAVSTLVVMQSTWGAALTISAKRFAGTAMGCFFGAVLATWFGPSLAVFTVAVFIIGIICALLRLDRVAYRYAGITLTVVMLVVRTSPAWIIAVHRFVEVSVGIAIGLALTALWRERRPAQEPRQRIGV